MKYLIIIISILIFKTGFAQVDSEVPFIKHLVDRGYYKEAIHLIDKNSFNYTESQLDSINYFKGWAHYSLKNLDESTQSLLKVGNESAFYWKSHFFAGYNQIYLKNYKDAEYTLSQMNIQHEPHLSLLNFELGGMEMLRGDWENGKKFLDLVNRDNAVLNQQITALEGIWEEHKNHREKSPALAGIMSAIIPGSGKVYAGKTGSGIASFLGTVGFGLITWENYHKAGITNAKTIIFGSIFAANYVSNIYGSVVSVKLIKNEHENALYNQILFQLHIPLRNFFD